MAAFLLRRLGQSILSLVLISLLVFTMMFAIGDPVAVMLPRQASQQDRENLRRELGLDRPLIIQYGMFIGRISRGDFGRSYYDQRPVMDLIAERAPATFELATVSLMMALLIGIPLGIVAGARPRSLLGRAAMGGSMLGISLPTFWIGLVFMMYLAVDQRWMGGFARFFEWIPPNGRGQTRAIGSVRWSFLTLDGWAHLLLPATTLALHHIAMLIRLVRSELLDTLQKPFIRVARSHGIPERSVIGRHAMRNTLIPIVTLTGVEFGQLLAFSVITETVFQWPGLGKLLIDRIYVDQPLVVAYLMLTGVGFLVINFAVDLTYALIDPRIRLSSSGDMNF